MTDLGPIVYREHDLNHKQARDHLYLVNTDMHIDLENTKPYHTPPNANVLDRLMEWFGYYKWGAVKVGDQEWETVNADNTRMWIRYEIQLHKLDETELDNFEEALKKRDLTDFFSRIQTIMSEGHPIDLAHLPPMPGVVSEQQLLYQQLDRSLKSRLPADKRPLLLEIIADTDKIYGRLLRRLLRDNHADETIKKDPKLSLEFKVHRGLSIEDFMQDAIFNEIVYRWEANQRERNYAGNRDLLKGFIKDKSIPNDQLQKFLFWWRPLTVLILTNDLRDLFLSKRKPTHNLMEVVFTDKQAVNNLYDELYNWDVHLGRYTKSILIHNLLEPLIRGKHLTNEALALFLYSAFGAIDWIKESRELQDLFTKNQGITLDEFLKTYPYGNYQ